MSTKHSHLRAFAGLGWCRTAFAAGAVGAALAGCGGGGDDPAPPPAMASSFDVAKPTCGTGDVQETGLQGQVPVSARVGGFKGFNCNLKLLSATPSARGQGIFGQFALMHDKSGHTCGYTGGAFQDSPGTSVVDLTDPTKAVETTILNTAAVMNPGEGLKVNEGRGLLVSAYYSNAASNAASPNDAAHGFDVYDIATDCRFPQLLASTTNMSFSMDGIKTSPATATLLGGNANFSSTERIYGHEGGFAPDGLTYYVGDVPHGVYHAIDITDPTHPKYLAVFQSPGYGAGTGFQFQGVPHNAAVSDDGNRGYFVNEARTFVAPDGMVPQTGEWHNGFMVVDTSEIQARKPGGQIKLLKEMVIRESSLQATIPVTIAGTKYLIAYGEVGAGQSTAKGIASACAAGIAPFATAQLYYMGDELNPTLINKVQLEVNSPKNCDQIAADIANPFPFGFMYDFHMCTVDNRQDASTLACGLFGGGIRVFDIRNPQSIKEIAYYVPPAKAATPAWCASLPFLEASTGTMYSWCSDSGVLALKFGQGVWPFAGTSTPLGKQL